jgi:hypothetical protein
MSRTARADLHITKGETLLENLESLSINNIRTPAMTRCSRRVPITWEPPWP